MLVDIDAPLEVEDAGVRRPLAVDDIRGPAGADGAPGTDGQDGADGDDGASAYEVAVANGFVGNEAAWLASLEGPAGADGVDGVDGADGADGDPGPTVIATTSAEGVARLSAAPADAAHPVVLSDTDPRNTDARAPTAHTHPQSDVTGLAAALAAKQDASTAATDTELAAETAARSAADTTIASAAAAAQATADAALPKAGGTMTGDVVLAGDPTANLHPATRQYVLAQIATLINGAPGALDTLKELADQLATDESAVSALTSTVAGKLAAASNLSDLVNAGTARTNLGLGTAATHAHGDYDAAGAAAAAQVASQPLDADLTAIAALSTTSFGRSLLALVDAAAALTALGTDTTSATRTPTDGSVTAAKVNTALKPSGSAASTDESLRRLGTGSTHAAAGDDSRFPTAGQKNALAGTNGTPGSGNEYVTKQAAGAVGGFAALDSGLLVPVANLPDLAQSKITGLTAALAAKEVAANKGAASGYASLDAGSKVPFAQLAGLGVIASKFYSGSSYNITSTVTTPLADVDATNLAVTFTPRGTSVIVVLSALAISPAANAMHWGLKDGTANIGNGPMFALAMGSAGPLLRITVLIEITGLTPGTAKTVKWSAVVGGGTGVISATSGAGAAGPAAMVVLGS